MSGTCHALPTWMTQPLLMVDRSPMTALLMVACFTLAPCAMMASDTLHDSIVAGGSTRGDV